MTRWPLVYPDNDVLEALPSKRWSRNYPIIDDPYALPNIVGSLAEVETTRDRYDELNNHKGYVMRPIPPDNDGWRIYDDDKDYKTTWCRDVFLIVEVES
jgi:hypothetical protein